MLRDLDLQDVYDSSECNLVEDLMVPCISNSISYIRGVGFFSSGWLRLAAKGVAQLIANGGKATFVVSPILEEADWDAMKLGMEAQESPEILSLLSRNIEELQKNLEEDTRNSLAWLIADELLDFYFAIPRNRDSLCDYHDKVGYCVDEKRDRVAFHGSFNDSVKGALNGEAFSVFRSWNEGQAAYVEQHEHRLTQLLDNANSQFEVFGIPETSKNDFIRLRTTPSRPYKRKVDISKAIDTESALSVPVSIREYQQGAIQAWLDNQCVGIFDMATGTGKTVTSLAAALAAYTERKKIALVVLVPYLHLLEQWASEVKSFGFSPICCSSDNPKWENKLFDAIDQFNLGFTDHLCVIAVHQTAAGQGFINAIAKCKNENLMLLGDEVHGLGAKNLRKGLLERATLRLGLSATPNRWYDEEGTAVLHDYFNKVVFEFPLEKAIGRFLTRYKYHPVPVHLASSELEEFKELTQRIVVMAAKRKQSKEKQSDSLNFLLIKRAQIIAKSEQKYIALEEILHKLKKQGAVKHLLVYCAPGEIDRVLPILAEKAKLRCHRFDHTVSLSERQKVIKSFASGTLDVLVAIKCLDEGVDIPATRTAIFMASTTNPREFVQRRGRVLRRSESKREAAIYDMLVLPNPDDQHTDIDSAKSIIRREMPRFAEFVSAADNVYSAKEIVKPFLEHYGMTHYFDMRPWDIYRQMLEDGEIETDSHFEH